MRTLAEPKTTVSSPFGDIVSLDGRRPCEEALREAREVLSEMIENAKIHLEEINNWQVRTHRGRALVMSYEELNNRG